MPVRRAQRTRLRRQGLGGNPVGNQMDNPDERAGGRAARTDYAWFFWLLLRKTRKGGRQNRRWQTQGR
jgi:hypothetical protein